MLASVSHELSSQALRTLPQLQGHKQSLRLGDASWPTKRRELTDELIALLALFLLLLAPLLALALGLLFVSSNFSWSSRAVFLSRSLHPLFVIFSSCSSSCSSRCLLLSSCYPLGVLLFSFVILLFITFYCSLLGPLLSLLLFPSCSLLAFLRCRPALLGSFLVFILFSSWWLMLSEWYMTREHTSTASIGRLPYLAVLSHQGAPAKRNPSVND